MHSDQHHSKIVMYEFQKPFNPHLNFAPSRCAPECPLKRSLAGSLSWVPNLGTLAYEPAAGLDLLVKPARPDNLPGFLSTILLGLLPNEAFWAGALSAIKPLATAG